jgi:hypothetical protein
MLFWFFSAASFRVPSLYTYSLRPRVPMYIIRLVAPLSCTSHRRTTLYYPVIQMASDSWYDNNVARTFVNKQGIILIMVGG